MSQFMNYQDEQCKILQAKLDDIFAKKFTARESCIPVFTSILLSSSWKSRFDFQFLPDKQLELSDPFDPKFGLKVTDCSAIDSVTESIVSRLSIEPQKKKIDFNPGSIGFFVEDSDNIEDMAKALMQLDEQVQKIIISKAMEFAVLPTDCAKTTLKVPFFIQNQAQPQLPFPNPRLASTIEYQYYHARLTQGRKYLFGGWALNDYLSFSQNTNATDNGFGNQSWPISDMINAQVSQAFDSILPKNTMLISEQGAFQLLYRPLYVTPKRTDNASHYTLRMPSGLPVDVVEIFEDPSKCKRTVKISTQIELKKSPNINGVFLVENTFQL